MAPKVGSLKEIVDELDFIQMEDLCSAREKWQKNEKPSLGETICKTRLVKAWDPKNTKNS